MAQIANPYLALGIPITLTLALMGVHLRCFPRLYRHAIEEGRQDIGPPWSTVVTGVNFILACTVRDLQNQAAIWGHNWELIQDRVARHTRDRDLIAVIHYAYRLGLVLDSLDSWRRRSRMYCIIVAIITLICPLASWWSGMKVQLLWQPVIGSAIVTFSLHAIFVCIVHRRANEAKRIHASLQGMSK